LTSFSSFGLALMVLALFFNGILIIDNPIKVVPFDLVVSICIFSLFVALLIRKKVTLKAEAITATEIGLVILIWTIFQALRSPEILRSTTLIIIVVRDLSTMLLTAILVSNYQKDLSWTGKLPMNRRINLGMQNILAKQIALEDMVFWTGFFVILAAIPLYILAISNPAKVILSPRPGLIYRAGEGIFPHFQGFCLNPIYFAVLILMTIAAGLAIHTTTRAAKLSRIIAVIVLLFAFIATLSRGAIIAALLGAFLLFCISAKLRHLLLSKSLLRTLSIPLIISLALLGLKLPGQNSSLLSRIIFRFQEARWDARVENWGRILPDINENPLLGWGLRSTECILFGNVIENSYIDIIGDQGLIGLLIWIVFITYILFLGFSKLQNDDGVLPWIYLWVVLLLFMLYASVQYDPLVWIIAGIIIGWNTMDKEGSLEAHEEKC
jgi:hypothetical protein